MKILIVNHDDLTRRSLASMLEQDGHAVLVATSGADALSRYTRHQPDLVLMDVALEDMDGYRCTQKINSLVGNRFAPVILTTSVEVPIILDRFLDSGAMDFISEPFSPLILHAKIGGHERVRDLYAHLEQLQARSSQEVMLAKHMFDVMVSRSPRDINFLKHWSVSAGNFSGDMLIYERTPRDELHILMADFTGHGLSAAIGALPTSDAFFAMSHKGCGIADIAREINRKLHGLLPVGHFCAATLIRLCPLKASLEVWIGGQPPLCLIGEDKTVQREMVSFHLPLGVVSDDEFSPETLLVSLADTSHLLLFSDGLLEARNASGLMFGEEGVNQALCLAMESGSHLLQQIKSSLVSFLAGMEPHDDVSLMTLDLGVQSH